MKLFSHCSLTQKILLLTWISLFLSAPTFAIEQKDSASSQQDPVRLFAEQMGGEVQLNWTLQAESRIDSFSLQRSDDGQTFREVARRLTSQKSQSYQMFDKVGPLSEKTFFFYRLQLFHQDGTTNFSEIGAVELLVPEKWKVKFEADHNKQILHVSFDASQKERIQIKVVDGAGRMIHVQKEELSPGANSFEIDTQYWPRQFYFLQFKSSSHFERHNFSKR